VFDPSPIHIVLLLLIVLLIFGTTRLPEIGRSLGRGIREFKGSVTGDDERTARPQPPPPTPETDRASGGPAAGDKVEDRRGRY
jgi:sec-independent protein translocase protein TatA